MKNFINKYNYTIETFFGRYLNKKKQIKYTKIFKLLLERIINKEQMELFNEMEANRLYEDETLEIYIDKYNYIEKPNNFLEYQIKYCSFNVKNKPEKYYIKKGGTIKIIVKYLETGKEDLLIFKDFLQLYNLYLEIKEL